MKYTNLLTGVAVFAVAACSQDASADDKLHPVQAICVDYVQTGSMEGTVTECHRDWGHERYTIEDLSLNMMGMTNPNNRHTIIADDQITSWDRDTNAGTITTNPMYDDIVQAADGDMESFARDMIVAMGFTQTGTIRTIAGESCEDWTSASMGQMCFTEDAIVLDQTMSMGPTSISRVAVDVRYGDGGDEANYQVPSNVTITQGPDLSAILGR